MDLLFVRCAISNFLLCYGLVFNPGGIPMMANTEKLVPKGVPLSGFRYMKGLGILLVEVYEGPVEKFVIWVSEM